MISKLGKKTFFNTPYPSFINVQILWLVSDIELLLLAFRIVFDLEINYELFMHLSTFYVEIIQIHITLFDFMNSDIFLDKVSFMKIFLLIMAVDK